MRIYREVVSWISSLMASSWSSSSRAMAAPSKVMKEISRSNQQPFSIHRILGPEAKYSLFISALPSQSQLSISGKWTYSRQSLASSKSLPSLMEPPATSMYFQFRPNISLPPNFSLGVGTASKTKPRATWSGITEGQKKPVSEPFRIHRASLSQKVRFASSVVLMG